MRAMSAIRRGQGRDGISLGHKDTDNVFMNYSVSGNGRAGIYFRDEVAADAASRNTFEDNTMEDNGRVGEPGYAIRIEGETRDLNFVSNTIRSRRKDGVVVQPVAIYIGPKADVVVAEPNLFLGEVENRCRWIQGGHNQLGAPVGR